MIIRDIYQHVFIAYYFVAFIGPRVSSCTVRGWRSSLQPEKKRPLSRTVIILVFLPKCTPCILRPIDVRLGRQTFCVLKKTFPAPCLRYADPYFFLHFFSFSLGDHGLLSTEWFECKCSCELRWKTILTRERGRTAARQAGEQVLDKALSGAQADSQAGRKAARHCCTNRQAGR